MRISRKSIGDEYKIWIPVGAMSDKVNAQLVELVNLVGGMTEVCTTGVWISDGEHPVVEEDVHIMQFITHELILKQIYEIAQTLIEEGQEAVLVYHLNGHYLLTGEVTEANPEIKFNWRQE